MVLCGASRKEGLEKKKKKKRENVPTVRGVLCPSEAESIDQLVRVITCNESLLEETEGWLAPL